MKHKVVGYLVKQGEEVIAATGNEREALSIAEKWGGICYKVVTRIFYKEDPITEKIVIYEGGH